MKLTWGLVLILGLILETKVQGFKGGPPSEEPKTPLERTKADLKPIQNIGRLSQLTKISVEIPKILRPEMPIQICGGELSDFEWKSIDIKIELKKIGLEKMSFKIQKEFYVYDEPENFPEPGDPNTCQGMNGGDSTEKKYSYDPPKKNSQGNETTAGSHGMLVNLLQMDLLEIGVDIKVQISGLKYKPKNIKIDRFDLNKEIEVGIKGINAPIDLHAFHEQSLYYLAPGYRKKEFNIEAIKLDIDGMPSIVNKLLSKVLSDRLAKMAMDALMQLSFKN